MGRRVCTECGTSYNVASVVDLERGYDMPAMLPPKECKDTLVSRKDDTMDVIEGECCCWWWCMFVACKFEGEGRDLLGVFGG